MVVIYHNTEQMKIQTTWLCIFNLVRVRVVVFNVTFNSNSVIL